MREGTLDTSSHPHIITFRHEIPIVGRGEDKEKQQQIKYTGIFLFFQQALNQQNVFRNQLCHDLLQQLIYSTRIMNGYYQYPPEYAQTHSEWPYAQSKTYNDWESVIQAFPHLKAANSEETFQNQNNLNGIVIRSANDDNVHKAIKYGIWTTTPKNKSKIQQLWQRKLSNNTNTYLFFSAVKSGMFEGVARLKSGYHEQTFPFWWQNHTLKFKGYFEIQWIFIKDVNNKYFSGLYNMQGEEVVKSKDCDTLDSQTTLKMLSVFSKKKAKRNIFIDFAYMDEREAQYIRKMYQVTAYYNQFNMGYANQGFDMSQFSMMGHPLNLMSNPTQPPMPVAPQAPMQVVPPMGWPVGTNGGQVQRNNLGFQMNPVSKNKKK